MLRAAYPDAEEFVLNQKFPIIKHALQLNWLIDYESIAENYNFRAGRFYGDTVRIIRY